MLNIVFGRVTDDLIYAGNGSDMFQARCFNSKFDHNWVRRNVILNGAPTRMLVGFYEGDSCLHNDDRMYKIRSFRHQIGQILLLNTRVKVCHKYAAKIFTKYMITREIFIDDIAINVMKLFADPRFYFDLDEYFDKIWTKK